jgi:hypothetical protein
MNVGRRSERSFNIDHWPRYLNFNQKFKKISCDKHYLAVKSTEVLSKLPEIQNCPP